MKWPPKILNALSEKHPYLTTPQKSTTSWKKTPNQNPKVNNTSDICSKYDAIQKYFNMNLQVLLSQAVKFRECFKFYCISLLDRSHWPGSRPKLQTVYLGKLTIPLQLCTSHVGIFLFFFFKWKTANLGQIEG